LLSYNNTLVQMVLWLLEKIENFYFGLI
jgi:hypothetical protein